MELIYSQLGDNRYELDQNVVWTLQNSQPKKTVPGLARHRRW